MGFYGNITNTSRTQFQFDKTYPNRKAMDDSAKIDGIYIGRYVLIEYEKFLAIDWCTEAYQKTNETTGALEFFLSARTEEREVSEGVKETIIIPQEDTRLIYNNSINIVPNKYIRVPGKNNREGQEIIKNLDDTAATYDTLYIILEGEDEYHNPSVEIISQIENSPYNENYNIDMANYGPGRGYDSTVWQKVYADEGEKYVMVAELNTVVPTFNITPDAPTMMPVVPHIDADSTNVYYDIHWQAPWGLRLKSANSRISVNPFDETGATVPGSAIKMTTSEEALPSDEITAWTRSGYNTQDGSYIDYYYRPIDTSNGKIKGMWSALKNNNIPSSAYIPAAIYYNKDGFNSSYINYSDENLEDKINIEPTGLSGVKYNTHKDNLIGRKEQVDTQELSIMLPSLGDSVAQLWDIIYGNEEINKSKQRNKFIKWTDGSTITERNGLRLIKVDGSNYNYQPEEIETLAGAINSAHDIIGTIIQRKDGIKATDLTTDDLKNWGKDYIYYLSDDNKFYKKHVNYEYEPITDISTDKLSYYSPVTFASFPEEGHYRLEDCKENPLQINGQPYPNYIKEKQYDKYVNYYSSIEALNPIPEFKEGDFKPETYFYLHKDYKVVDSESKDTIADAYRISLDETYDKNKEYFKITHTALPDNIRFWNNNETYYTANFAPVEEPTIEELNAGTLFVKDENEDKYYRASETSLVIGRIYYTPFEYIEEEVYDSNKQYFMVTQTVIGNTVYIERIQYKVASNISLEDFNAEGAVFYIKIDNEYYLAESYTPSAIYYTKHSKLEKVEGTLEILPENINEVILKDINIIPEIDGKQGMYCQYRYKGDGNHDFYIILNKDNCFSFTDKIVVILKEKVSNFYQSNTYYFKIEDKSHPYYGSYIFDNSPIQTEGRIYYNQDDVKPEGLIGFYETPIYEPNEFYYINNRGDYVLEDAIEPRQNVQYYKKNGLYVIEDTESICPIGMEWNLNILDEIPNSITLGYRKEILELQELKGFARDFNTMHGLVLNINYLLEKDNTLIRDYTSVQGALNRIKDLFSQFGELRANEILVTDKYGQITSTTFEDDAWIFTNYADRSKIIINHQYIGEETGKGERSFNENQISHKLAFGETIFNPSFAFKTDDMGHLNKYSTSGVDWTLPTVSYETITPKENDFGNMVIDMELVSQANNTNLHFIETRQNVGNLLLTDYVSTSTNNVIEVLPTDSINEAFNKVNIAFDNLDYKRETAAETPIFITEINQTNGLITPIERVIHQNIPYISENYSQADLVSSKGIHDYVIGVTKGLKGGQANHYFNGIIEEEGRLKLQTQEIDNIISQNSTDEAVASPKAVYNYVNKLQCGTDATYVSNITTDDVGNIKPIVNEVSTFISNASLNTDLVTPKAVYNYVNQIETGNNNTYVTKIILDTDGFLKASSTEISTDMTINADSNVQLVSQEAVLNYLNNNYTGNTVINSVGTITNGTWDSTIAKDRVVTEAIKNDAITTDKIIGNAVTEAKILNNAITTNKIADSAVTEAKILNNAVTTNKIANSAITTDKILNSAVTTDKIADSAVTNAKIATGLEASKSILTNYSSSTYETSNLLVSDNVLIAFKKLEDRIKELETQVIDLTARIETLEGV